MLEILIFLLVVMLLFQIADEGAGALLAIAAVVVIALTLKGCADRGSEIAQFIGDEILDVLKIFIGIPLFIFCAMWLGYGCWMWVKSQKTVKGRWAVIAFTSGCALMLVGWFWGFLHPFDHCSHLIQTGLVIATWVPTLILIGGSEKIRKCLSNLGQRLIKWCTVNKAMIAVKKLLVRIARGVVGTTKGGVIGAFAATLLFFYFGPELKHDGYIWMILTIIGAILGSIIGLIVGLQPKSLSNKSTTVLSPSDSTITNAQTAVQQNANPQVQEQQTAAQRMTTHVKACLRNGTELSGTPVDRVVELKTDSDKVQVSLDRVSLIELESQNSAATVHYRDGSQCSGALITKTLQLRLTCGELALDLDQTQQLLIDLVPATS